MVTLIHDGLGFVIKPPNFVFSHKGINYMTQKITILLGEDSTEADESLLTQLETNGMRCLCCANGIDLVRRAILKNPDLIFIDVALARLNGYQCARLLKYDPVTRNTPIIHFGMGASPVDHYWSKVCGGDMFLDLPLEPGVLDTAINTLVSEGGKRSRPVATGKIIPEMNDQAILGLATNMLEQDLLRLNILKEINMVDTISGTPGELISSLFAIINSLYPFSSGSALLIYEDHIEFYFCRNGTAGVNRAVEIKSLILDQLKRRQDVFIDPEMVVDIFLESEISGPASDDNEDVYLHIGEPQGPVQTALAFENIHLESYSREEKSIFHVALELARGVIEKKIFFRMNQELSLIDIATRGYSITFFMEVLGREMENATRHNYVITLFTLLFVNFDVVTKDMDTEQLKSLIKAVQTSILRSMRKTDVVARWNQANFAFLLTHTALEGSREAIVRVKKNLLKDLSGKVLDIRQLKLDFGICQFDSNRDKTAELFLKNAMPRKKKKDV